MKGDQNLNYIVYEYIQYLSTRSCRTLAIAFLTPNYLREIWDNECAEFELGFFRVRVGNMPHKTYTHTLNRIQFPYTIYIYTNKRLLKSPGFSKA